MPPPGVPPSPVRFRILGTVEYFDGDRWSPVGAAKQRALLAVLLLHANQVVPADRLISELWTTNTTPASASGLLAGYVWRLRRALPDAAADILVTRAPGYQLLLSPGALDVHEYETHVAAGRTSLAANDLAAASESFTAALAVWRGVPLADVALTPSVMAETARLEESRLSVVEARIGAEIGLGRHEALLPELKLLVSQFPLRERLHAHLMVTLYRCGQQADALGAYHDLRRLLINELGIEPSKPLRELQQRMLLEDPLLLAPAADPAPLAAASAVAATAAAATAVAAVAVAPGAAAAVAVAPRLAPDETVFVGRAAEVAALTTRLRAGDPVCAVHGLVGAGKTSLVRRVGQAVADRFPDGQFYLDMRGSAAEPPVGPAEAVRSLLSAFGVSAAAGSDPEQAAARWSAVLADRRVLVILDDVRDDDQVRPFLPPPPGCAVLLAGRSAVAAGAGHPQLKIGRLSPTGSVELLRRLLGAERIDADPAAAADIAQLCEQLPLALRSAATWLAVRPMWSLRDFAVRLSDPRRRLDLVARGEHSVRASLEAGTRLVRRRAGPAAALTALGLIGVLDLAVVSVPTIAALLDTSAETAHAIGEHLVDAGLIESLAVDCYWVPDLLRLFAREQQVGTGDAAAAVRRVVDRYIDLVREQLALVDEADPRAPGEPRRTGSVPPVLSWYRRELGTLRVLAERDDTEILGKTVNELRLALPGAPRAAVHR